MDRSPPPLLLLVLLRRRRCFGRLPKRRLCRDYDDDDDVFPLPPKATRSLLVLLWCWC